METSELRGALNSEAIQAIVESSGTAAPEPDSIGRWWQKPMKPPELLTTRERDALLTAFDGVCSHGPTGSANRLWIGRGQAIRDGWRKRRALTRLPGRSSQSFAGVFDEARVFELTNAAR